MINIKIYLLNQAIIKIFQQLIIIMENSVSFIHIKNNYNQPVFSYNPRRISHTKSLANIHLNSSRISQINVEQRMLNESYTTRNQVEININMLPPRPMKMKRCQTHKFLQGANKQKFMNQIKDKTMYNSRIKDSQYFDPRSISQLSYLPPKRPPIFHQQISANNRKPPIYPMKNFRQLPIKQRSKLQLMSRGVVVKQDAEFKPMKQGFIYEYASKHNSLVGYRQDQETKVFSNLKSSRLQVPNLSNSFLKIMVQRQQNPSLKINSSLVLQRQEPFKLIKLQSQNPEQNIQIKQIEETTMPISIINKSTSRSQMKTEKSQNQNKSYLSYQQNWFQKMREKSQKRKLLKISPSIEL